MLWHYQNFSIFIHSYINGHLRWVCLLAVVNMPLSTWMCTYLFVSAFGSFAYVPGSGSAGSNLWGCRMVFHRSCTILGLYQQCLHVPFSPHPHQYLLFLFFFNNSRPDECKVVSHCGFDLHSLVISDVEHFFMCFSIICTSSLETFQIFCPFLMCSWFLLFVVSTLLWLIVWFEILG